MIDRVIINKLVRKIFPVGFVYTQWTGKRPPNELWPFAEWEEITSHYKGCYPRVNGWRCAPWGQVQQPQQPGIQVYMSQESLSDNWNTRDYPYVVGCQGSFSSVLTSTTESDERPWGYLSTGHLRAYLSRGNKVYGGGSGTNAQPDNGKDLFVTTSPVRLWRCKHVS